ncbi:30S ribosome-binding factor RbfA [Enterobacteriaceae endosymbiont of Neohaemonia nigricornis]|uniref:30S ribosome-binding factor RbfA n=1 Tax=Enterobacteriaceae endosymbiont of Neohaemonia nigricornis TaxID=2675792 RepID=UPI0014496A76|nr:30S ribosome-binding factor RbfA [Enterobacteriaceae endosymbiont of Neohaemonia nigricornis]QJC30497.1 30S ribosome-binding factor RbfA [Enterobacteriaceae endosymbiont of Neohaemonia nigricornis]
MEKKLYRQLKIANELKKQISYIFQYHIDDIRLNKFITITDLLISKDLSYAKIFIMIPYKQINNNAINNFKQELHFLNNITGYIRFILKKTMLLRNVPQLKFFLDSSLEEGNYIYNLIKNN